MASIPLQLPTIQNWNCHSCSACCREHSIEVSEQEYDRIVKQDWPGEEGFDEGQPIFQWHAGPPWKKRYRLANREDGACVFLDDNNLCRIHAKFGESAKPLACRVYPFALHPSGKKATVSLRFSCPSVIANRGRRISEQVRELRQVAKLVVPQRRKEYPPPPVSPGEKVTWSDFDLLTKHLEAEFAEEDVPFVIRLLRSLFWVNLIGQSALKKISGARLEELIEILRTAADEETPIDVTEFDEPSKLGRLHFRLLVAQYARKDTAVNIQKGLRGRYRLLMAALRFARGQGQVPPLQTVFQPVPFVFLEAQYGPLPAEADELFARYFRVKIQGLHFCGPAYYNIPFAEGFQSLALVFAATMWLARLLAASEERMAINADDVGRALAIADHHHGYTPTLGFFSARHRVRALAKTGDIARLCAWYSK